MKRYHRAEEMTLQRRGNVESIPEESADQQKQHIPETPLKHHTPEYQEPGYERFMVDMFEIATVQIPKDTKVELYTEHLSTCTAVAIAVREPISGEAYGVLSHFPFYTGNEFTQELSRYDRLTDDRAEKKVVIVIPYVDDPKKSRDASVIKEELRQSGFSEDQFTVLQHAPTGAIDGPIYHEGKVVLTFEKNGNIHLRYLALYGKLTTTQLFDAD